MTTTNVLTNVSEAAYFQAVGTDAEQALTALERLGCARGHAAARADAYEQLAATERDARTHAGAVCGRGRETRAARRWHADGAWLFTLLALIERAQTTPTALAPTGGKAIADHVATRTTDPTVRVVVQIMACYGIDALMLAHLHTALTHPRVGMRGEAADGLVTRLPAVYADRTG
ncbi:hypothetical protein CLV63_113203 [Murinocardiopsis flavida]|uniref:Uncharacterized protein n=1 Tax=Murinocardiopsis flavida TaxID=645275 RepID=A0A2P8DFQ3_9ACTN|nr:hypothetical protein [Murinocardiopsis flavida]PSK96040.1 hypothetical protein CLV63_113203 [Murinocardiopsis flavida]